MRNKISLIQFLISLIIGIYVFIMILYIDISSFSFYQFLFMTIWNCYISTIYFVIIAICDFSFYIYKSNKLEKINTIFRENLSPAFTALTYLVSFTFWVMIFPVIMKGKNEGEEYDVSLYIDLYVHLFLTIFQTIDIFLSYRENKGIVIKYDFLIASFIMGIYSILMLVLIFGFNIAIYPFLKNMTWYKGIGEILLFQLMIFIFYLIHVGLIKLKYKCKIFVLIDNNEEKKLSDNEQQAQIESIN